MNPEEALEEKRRAAQLAMEGPEWTAKRERETKEKQSSQEKTRLEDLLKEIAKKKEGLELEWVKLDDQRKIIREQLAPILEREKQTEEAETKLELEETSSGLPKEKQAVEKKRQIVQDTRREVEKEKWSRQEKLWQLDSVIEANTVKYRTLLDEEDESQKRLDQLANG